MTSSEAGGVRLVLESNMSRVLIDENGDGSADFNLWLYNVVTPTLEEGDFLL